MMHPELALQREEAAPEHSLITGKTVVSSNLRQYFGVTIVAIKRTSGDMELTRRRHCGHRQESESAADVCSYLLNGFWHLTNV